MSALMSMLSGADEWDAQESSSGGLPQLTVRIKENSKEAACCFDIVFLYGDDWPATLRLGLVHSSKRIVGSQWNSLKKSLVSNATSIAAEGDLGSLPWTLLEAMREDFLDILRSFRKNLRTEGDAQESEEAVAYPPASRQRSASLNSASLDGEEREGLGLALSSSPKQRGGVDDAMKTALYNMRSKRDMDTSSGALRRAESESEPDSEAAQQKRTHREPPSPANAAAHKGSRHAGSRGGASKRGASSGFKQPNLEEESSQEQSSPTSSSPGPLPGSVADQPAEDTAPSSSVCSDSSNSSSSDSGEESDTEGSGESDSGSSDSSSSSSGGFRQYSTRPAAKKAVSGSARKRKGKRLAAKTDEVSFDDADSPPRKPRATTLTPVDRRRQIALRMLLEDTDVDDTVRESIIQMMEGNDVLHPALGADDSGGSKTGCTTDAFKAALSKLITSETLPSRHSAAPSGRFGRSWYREQLVPIKTLGQGGQGRVEQVQNNLDGMYYAVKRVELSQFAVPPQGEAPGGVKKKQKKFERYRYVIAEIRTLARLGHPYIVRYFVAWFEEEKTPRDGSGPTAVVEAQHSKIIASSYGCDDDSDDSSENQDDDDSGFVTKTVCYIQMEYCYQETLRQVIDRRVFTANAKGAECGYKILWQLLQCVSYIHEQGVIHRDLKPENIFFDLVAPTGGEYYAGDIKVGDFGLATGHTAQAASPESAQQDSPDKWHSSGVHHSSGIGTPLYCAPEQELGGQYTNKVDEYSVGIIAYEMFSGFASSHERIESILQLRATGKVPLDWVGSGVNKNLPALVESLVRRDTESRITAAEVLENDWLPRPHRHKDMLAAVQLFVDERAKMAKLLHERYLNDPNALNSSDWLYQDPLLKGRSRSAKQLQLGSVSECRPQSLLSAAAYRTYAKEAMTDTFKKMGAIELDVPAMLPSNTIIKDHPAMKCTDDAGNLFMIPKNPSICFARYLSRPQATHIPLPVRRYGLHKVPISITDNVEVASFDVVTTSAPANDAVDAEMVNTLASLLEQFQPPPPSQWLISVNHTDLLHIIEAVCRQDSDVPCTVDSIMAAFKHHSSRPHDFSEALGLRGLGLRVAELLSVRKKLGVGHSGNHKGAESTSVFLQTAGRLGVKAALQKEIEKGSHKQAQKSKTKGLLGSLDPSVRSELEETATAALLHLHKLEAALMELGLKHQVVIEFDMTYSKDHTIYSGLLWGVSLVGQETKKCRDLSLYGCGGRYTQFLQELRSHYERIARIDKEEMAKYEGEVFQVPPSTAVCGGSLSLTAVVSTCAAVGYGRRRQTPVLCDELVFVGMDPASYDAVLLLCIATEMRQIGLLCDYQLDASASVSTQQETCRHNGVTWVLIPTGKNIASAAKSDQHLKFKLRNLTAGVLRKDKKGKGDEKEYIFDAPVSDVAREVLHYLQERKSAAAAGCVTGGYVQNSASTLFVSEKDGNSLNMKLFTDDGKTHPEPTQVLAAIDTTFRNAPPSKTCISTYLTIPEIREVVSLTYTSSSFVGLQDARHRQLAKQLCVRAPKEPLILVHSQTDMQFEVFVSSNMKIGQWDSQSQAQRSEKGGKRIKDDRKGKMRKVAFM